jgi:hypothetical protein
LLQFNFSSCQNERNFQSIGEIMAHLSLPKLQW